MAASVQAADSLPSWNEGKAKQSILDFVSTVTNEASPDFVPAAERIATIDNDGNLWAEQPMLELLDYLHHTDAEREWAYDRKSSMGRLDKGLDEAQAKGWTVVDMKQDWKVIYPNEKK